MGPALSSNCAYLALRL